MGSTIGIFGSGQLGMMLIWAASQLGYKTYVYSDVPGCACNVATRQTVASYDDHEALRRFARLVNVVICEFENIPTSVFKTIGSMLGGPKIYPGELALSVSQDRWEEKRMARGLGFQTANSRFYQDGAVLPSVDLGGDVSFPAILKTARGGYDGKGQKRVNSEEELKAALAEFGNVPCILEEVVDFQREFSMILVRGQDGDMRFYPPFFNSHEEGILRKTLFTGRLKFFEGEAIHHIKAFCAQIAEKLDVVGLLAVEMFLTQDGRVLFNEIAPRPHNSGHITLDCAVTSQFEQHIRAAAGLPLGSCMPTREGRMFNYIEKVPEGVFNDKNGRVYLYGKEEKPGRKVGHVNSFSTDPPWSTFWSDWM